MILVHLLVMDRREFPLLQRLPKERKDILEAKNSLRMNPSIIPMDGERWGQNYPKGKIQNGGSKNLAIHNNYDKQVNCQICAESHFSPMRLTNSSLNSSTKVQDTCKVGADHGRLKGRRRLLSLLEHNGDDVISNVALPLHLDVSISNITKEVTQTRQIHRVKTLTQHGNPRWSQSPTLPPS